MIRRYSAKNAGSCFPVSLALIDAFLYYLNPDKHLEYQLTCEQILETGALNPDTNHVLFVPSIQYKGGRISSSRVVQARRLLERCRQNNPGTQWNMLAEWELEYDLGMQVQQVVIPPPRSVQGTFVPIPAT